MKKTLSVLFTMMAFLLFPAGCWARTPDQITDWYVKNFDSEITVNTDSSLHIVENITADCGNLPNKHGIFRTLPTFYQKTETKKVKTPIKLDSITDFNGNSINYSTQHDYAKGTVTWQIGDPDTTVTGENNYRIVYDVKNAIRFDDPNFDEFYWNVIGQFWRIDIDAAVVTVKFPNNISQSDAAVNIYTGAFGAKGTDAASSWVQNNTLKITSTRGFKPGEGITASVTFPKNIITPHQPTWMEKYGKYLWLLFPILAFIICYRIWSKYGRDPKLHRAIIAEYAAPDNITPMQMDMIINNRNQKNSALSATIIRLAVLGIIKIEEVPKKWLLGTKDYKLSLLRNNFENSELTDAEKYLVSCLFTDHDQGIAINYLTNKTSKEVRVTTSEVTLSSLRNRFYSYIPLISEKVKKEKPVNDSFGTNGFSWKWIFLGCGIASIFLMVWAIITVGNSSGLDELPYPAISGFVSVVIFFLFAFLMPQRTQYGAEMLWKIQGFKLYLETAEKYREQFNEKENIFEKFLPYAMVFGIVGLWVKKIKMIYGEEYFNTYHPIWYGGYVGNFNVDSLTESINDVSNSMSSTLASSPSSSGSGGGGFSGGGGGGGGGGGW